MLLNKFFKGGFYQFIYDDKEEAIEKAKYLYKNLKSASVIESQGKFYVEAPASDFLRSWEIKHFYNGIIYKR